MSEAVQDPALAFLAACRGESGAVPKHKDRLVRSASQANNSRAAGADGCNEGEAKRKHHRLRGTGSLFRQKGRAIWMMKYCVNGKAIYQSTGKTDRVAAERVLQRKLREIAAGEFIEPKLERTTVAELAGDTWRDYRQKGNASLHDAVTRWERHLKPVFGHLKAVGSDLLHGYIEKRKQEGAANSTINRELALLRRMLRLGSQADPPKVRRVPRFPKLQEDNIRTGFLEDTQYAKLQAECAKEGLWLRAMLEVAYTYGWRESELLNMRVKQVEFSAVEGEDGKPHPVGYIRLAPGRHSHKGGSKNKEGREVWMTPAVYTLLQALTAGKQPDDYVFTRDGGKPVRDFRDSWWRACIHAGLGHMVCLWCGAKTEGFCQPCKDKKRRQRLKYEGLLFHDLRRSAARGLRRAGVAEGVIMKIDGWKTRDVFERYNIVSHADMRDALLKREQARRNPMVSATVSAAQLSVQVNNSPGERAEARLTT